MDAGKYGPDVVADTDTYAAIFNDPFISTRREIAQLVELYKEMSDRGVKSDVRIDKALILFARKSEDYELLAKLLGSTSPDSIPRNHGSQAARVISARVKAYTAIHNPRLAYDELMKISSYKIPNDTRHIPKELTGSDFDNVRVPLQYNRTRDAYFLSLRSGYESLIRIRLLRKNPQMARDLLDDMRRTSYLPPTSKIYNQFIRFHAKRKNIHELRELYEMMREDGLKVTEHLYTKFMTSCMFTPKERLFNFLKKRVADKYSLKPDGGEKNETAIELDMAASHDLPEVDGRDLGASSSGGYLGNSAAGLNGYEKSGSANSNPPDAELLAKMDKELDELIFNPGECIRFFRDMLTDYGVSPDAIQDRRYIPNASITNAVMRAYTQLRQYSLVLREFVRYCYHQKHLYPNSRPLEVEQYPRTMGYIFRMALGAARMLNDNKKSHRIYTTMREWDVRAFEKKACGYRRQ
ncbi:hypothetical protein LPJ72_005380 [Coemansia sp. Benny D160-2]|nr:hypothetical protein LPJ72_005380 [Coemansia sp. Benny D160-2]